jgi:diamine N-acetyltransferase
MLTLAMDGESSDGDARAHGASIRHPARVDNTVQDVSLREITDANRPAVEALAVTPDQEHYVAGVAESLEEAAATPAACPWYRAVYAGEDPVGFVMLSDGIPDGYP